MRPVGKISGIIMIYNNSDLPSSEGTLGHVNANHSESLRASLLFCVHMHKASLRQGCYCEKNASAFGVQAKSTHAKTRRRSVSVVSVDIVRVGFKSTLYTCLVYLLNAHDTCGIRAPF